MPTGKSRNVIGNISLSLDGRVNGPDGDYDMGWIVPHAISEGARAHMSAVTNGATTALLGRKNYEGFASFWPAVANDENAHPADRAFSQWLNETEKIVFSTTLSEVTWMNGRLATDDPAAMVRALRTREGGDIIVLASSSIIRQLVAADELDRLSVTLCPEIAGGGARFLDEMPGRAWKLAQSTPTESGALCLLYDRART